MLNLETFMGAKLYALGSMSLIGPSTNILLELRIPYKLPLLCK